MPPPRKHCGKKGLTDFYFVDAVNQLYQHKNAFTLAEVLITLGIIGVVAALIMPALTEKIQHLVLRNQLKKSLSVFNSGLLSTINDMGGDIGCYYTTDSPRTIVRYSCQDFFDTFTKNLKLVKTCNGNGLAENCVPRYSKYTTSGGCSAFNENSFNIINTEYVLADGSVIIPYDDFNYSLYPIFAFDINGLKGPNKPGYDLFAIEMNYNRQTGTIYFNSDMLSCIPFESGGLTNLSDVMGK